MILRLLSDGLDPMWGPTLRLVSCCSNPRLWLWTLLAAAACGGATSAITNGLVDVGGHRLFIECTGIGSPTVVLDAGLTNGGESWSSVQPQIAEFTRVCNYDRAGVGRSEAVSPQIRKAVQEQQRRPPAERRGCNEGGEAGR